MPKKQAKFEFSKPTFGANTSESRILFVTNMNFQRSQELVEQKKKQKDMETLRKPIEHVNLEEKLEIIKNDSFYYAPNGKRAFCKEDLETQISMGLSINSLNDNECSPCKLTNPE